MCGRFYLACFLRQICDLKYEKPLDLKSINLGKARIKVLKDILRRWGEKCKGCTSKKDLLDKIDAVREKHGFPKENKEEL